MAPKDPKTTTYHPVTASLMFGMILDQKSCKIMPAIKKGQEMAKNGKMAIFAGGSRYNI